MNGCGTTFISPSDHPGRFDFLLLHNYLGEFKTEVDKAKVRFNLGIPDSYSFNWGNIGGVITQLQDLILLLNQISARNTADYQTVLLKINANLNDISLLSRQLVNVQATTETLNRILGEIPGLSLLVINVSQNASDILTIKRDVAALQSGGDTSILTKVNANTAAINTLNTLVGNVSSSSLQNLVDLLSNKVNGIDSMLTNITSLIERVTALESASTNVLKTFTVSPTSITVVEGSDDQSVILTSTWSLTGSQIVPFDEVTVNPGINTVASWDYNTNKIKINGQGNTSITFVYRNKEAVVNINVTANVQNPKCYVGCSRNYSQIYENPIYEYETVAGNWGTGGIPFKVFGDSIGYNLFIITTENITSIKPAIGEYDVNQLFDSIIEGTNYKIYKLPNLHSTDFKLTITTN